MEPPWPRGSVLGLNPPARLVLRILCLGAVLVSSHSSHHPQEVFLVQFSLYVHKGRLKPIFFLFFLSLIHFIRPTHITCAAPVRTTKRGHIILVHTSTPPGENLKKIWNAEESCIDKVLCLNIIPEKLHWVPRGFPVGESHWWCSYLLKLSTMIK